MTNNKQLRYRGILLEDMTKDELIEAFICLHKMYLATSENLFAITDALAGRRGA